MAKKETQSQENKHFSIETLKEKNRTSDAVYKGMCVAKGWQRGKMVSCAEYKQAQECFLRATIGGNNRK